MKVIFNGSNDYLAKLKATSQQKEINNLKEKL